MSQRIHTLRRLSAWTIGVWLLLHATSSVARPRIAVAVEALAHPNSDATTQAALTRSIVAALDAHPSVSVVPREAADLVLYGSITSLSDLAERDGREVDCRVSLIVTEAQGGAIRLTLSGRAVARGMSRNPLSLTHSALGAAVRSALSPLAQGLTATRRLLATR